MTGLRWSHSYSRHRKRIGVDTILFKKCFIHVQALHQGAFGRELLSPLSGRQWSEDACCTVPSTRIAWLSPVAFDFAFGAADASMVKSRSVVDSWRLHWLHDDDEGR